MKVVHARRADHDQRSDADVSAQSPTEISGVSGAARECRVQGEQAFSSPWLFSWTQFTLRKGHQAQSRQKCCQRGTAPQTQSSCLKQRCGVALPASGPAKPCPGIKEGAAEK